MKARVKLTGVLVDVVPYVNLNNLHSRDNQYECDGMVYKECELDFLNIEDSRIDWEQRRYELARAAMQGILSNGEAIDDACRTARYTQDHTTPKAIARCAIAYADALIKKLKGEINNDNNSMV